MFLAKLALGEKPPSCVQTPTATTRPMAYLKYGCLQFRHFCFGFTKKKGNHLFFYFFSRVGLVFNKQSVVLVDIGFSKLFFDGVFARFAVG